eukprot:CAMPEP_0115841752 /NCGR_PEP_ID=MMETSP0287-20121206/7449_1 /TAXON_ID=412157 /ORGANISM="Chrysochromulina rotalis, Strain UIO044" /LENGTH=134 /DNA_ID=CAMNT_0003295405 /DNA_START=13 /DNA_END=413 /DNA_ORIENTATION=+
MMHVVLQPKPAIFARSQAQFVASRELKRIAAKLQSEGAPLSTKLSSAGPSLEADLQVGLDVLVWIGMGYGWEATEAAPTSTAVLIKMITQLARPPRMVALALKYGAHAFALALHAAGVDTILWVKAESVMEIPT